MADNVKTVSVRMETTGYDDAKLKIEKLRVASDELGREHPEIQVQIDAQKALLEARLLRDGIKKELSKVTMDVGTNNNNGGMFGKFLESSGLGGSGNSSGFLSGLDAAPLGGLPALAAAIPIVGTLLVEAGGLVAGLAAATAGVGAFGLLALPTFDKIKNAYTAVSAAQKAYNQAAAIQGEDPTKTHAAAAAAALLKLKVAEEGMSPGTKAAVTGIQSLVDSFDKLAKAFAPTVMTVFNQALKIANQLLPTLKQPATDAAKAIEGLLTQFSRFTQSSGFKDWLGSFDKLIGPSVTAIGQGVGKVIVAVGKLITAFSAHDVQHALNIFFDTISGAITGLTWVITHAMHNWDDLSQGMEKAFITVAPPIIGAIKIITDALLGLFGDIIGAEVKLFGWIPGIGPKLKGAQKSFDDFRAGVDNTFNAAIGDVNRWGKNLANAPKVAKLKGDITDLNAKLASAERQLNDPNLTKARTARIDANISNLDSQLASARAQLAALNGMTATTYVNTVSGPGGTPGTKKRAAGGPTSGLTLVGEMGPELVQTPPGSYVYNARQTAAMTGGDTYNIYVSALVADRNTGKHVVDAIRKFEQGSGKSWRK